MIEPEQNEPDRGEQAAEQQGENLIGGARQRVQEVFDAAERAAASIIEEANEQARREIEEARRDADRQTLERARMVAELTDGLLEQAATIKRQSDALAEALDAALAELELGAAADEQAEPPAPEQPVGASGAMPEEVGVGEPEPAPSPERSAERDLQATEPPVAPPAETGPARRPERGERRGGAQSPERLDPLEALRERIAGSMRSRTAPAAPRREGERRGEPPVAPGPRGGGGAADGARLLATQMAVAGSSREEIEARLRDEFGIDDAGAILDGVV